MQRVPFVGRACCLRFGSVPVACRGCSTSPALYWGHPTSPVRCWERPISCTGSFVFSCFCGRTAGRCVAVGGMSNCWGNVGWRGALPERVFYAVARTSIRSHRSLRDCCVRAFRIVCRLSVPVAATGRDKNRCRGGGEGWDGALPERVFCAVTFLPAFTSHLVCIFRYLLSPSNRGKGGKNTSADNPETVSRCGGGEAGSLT